MAIQLLLESTKRDVSDPAEYSLAQPGNLGLVAGDDELWYAFDGITLTPLQGVPTSRTITAGLHLSGGGDLSADRTINFAAESDVSMGGFKVTNVADATNATDAATLGQLQAIVEGRDDKEAVEWSTTGPVTLSGLGTQGGGEWTGSLSAGDRLLVKDQASTPTNGIYLAAAGAWTRALDANTGAEISHASVLVTYGATHKGDTWKQSLTVTTIGTDAQTWVQIAEGDPITLTVVGAVPNASGASLSGQALTLQPADGTNPGLLTAGAQSIGGAKTFIGAISATNLSGTNSGNVTLAAVGAVPNANAATLAGQVLNLEPASATQPGVLTIGVQSIAGAKTFTGNITANNLSGTNTGDQTITLTGDVTGSGAGSFATIAVALQGIPVSTTDPQPGMTLAFGPTSWQPTVMMRNVVNFGADPETGSDAIVPIYNAIISCGLKPGAQYLVTTADATTSTGSFSLSVTANAAHPGSGTGTLIAQTTRGLVYMTFSNGTTGTLTCAVTAGVAGGVILAGSFVGVRSDAQIGGIVFFPAGIFLTGYEITNSIPGVKLMGVAGATTADAGNNFLSGGSWLFYAGTPGGTVVRHVPISGTGGLQAGQALKGVGVEALNFACGGPTLGYGHAAHAVQMLSCSAYTLKNLYAYAPAMVAYDFSVLGNTMLSEAHDNTRATEITGLRFRNLEKPSGASEAQVVAAQTAITAGAGTNINTFDGAGTISTAALTAAAWPTAHTGAIGLAQVQAVDQLTGNVMWYLVSYTGVAGPGLTGVRTLPLWWNQANSTTLNAATPSSADPQPNALLFAGALVRPAYAAYATGLRLHGSLTANTCVMTFANMVGVHWCGDGAYLGNCDNNHFAKPTWNRYTPGAGANGIGWDVQGATAIGGAAGTSRNNTWDAGDPGLGGINLRGTGGTLAYTAPATPNRWDHYELSNGAPIPVEGTGCSFEWTGNGCLVPGPIGSAAAGAQAITVGGVGSVVTGCSVPMPPQGWQVGTIIKLSALVDRTNVGTASWQALVRVGTANGTGDAAISTITSTATTAVADAGVLTATIQILTLGAAATASVFWAFSHNNSGAVGLGSLHGSVTALPNVVTTATFNSTTAALFINLGIIAGATFVMVARQGFAECIRGANP